MTPRERILAVYRGDTPDVVPYMLDVSHWFYHKHRLPWDLSRTFETPEVELINYHKRVGVGFYLARLQRDGILVALLDGSRRCHLRVG